MRFRLTLVALVVLASASASGQPSPRVRDQAVRPEDRLLIAVFHLGPEIKQLAKEEFDKLLAACGTHLPRCFEKHFTSARRQIAVLRARPDPASPPVGFVHALLRLSDEHALEIGLDLELADKRGEFLTWMRTVGDWFYGIYVSGVRVDGDWLQLMEAPLPAAAWVTKASPSLEIDVLPIEGELLGFKPLPASFPDGRRRQIPLGGYLVQRVRDGVVEFRAEVPSVRPCDGRESAKEPPKAVPPTLRTPAAELFDPDGTPRFLYMYQKGC
jgi:hypothetical protein